MKGIWWFLIGVVLTIIILKVVAGRSTTGTSSVSSYAKALMKTQQAENLVRTNEFRELIKTSEFKKLVTALAVDEIKVLSSLLSTSTVTK